MTNNTIPNVPRELYTCTGKGGVYEHIGLSAGAGMARGEQRQVYRCTATGLIFHRECMDFKERMERLSAPSPAGVDGLNTDRNAAFKACPESGCDWGSFYLGWKARGEVEQAIIDGLRGEVAQLQSMLATVSKAGIRVRTDRDQQAQRIGELEGLLLRVQVSLSLDDTEWGHSGAGKYKLLADIRAALSASSEPKQCT